MSLMLKKQVIKVGLAGRIGALVLTGVEIGVSAVRYALEVVLDHQENLLVRLSRLSI
jgi:ethanolamine utilization microcompartment shell protein EutS